MRDFDITTAIQELESLIDEGSSFAMAALGNIFLYGSYGIPVDEAKGKELLSRSASMGSIEGAYRLACFLDSRGRHAEAFDIYQRLAERRFSPAIYRLAWAYHQGRWVSQDKSKARELFAEAMNEGHLLAKQKLSYELRQSAKVADKIYGHFLLITLVVPRALQYRRQPRSDRLRS